MNIDKYNGTEGFFLIIKDEYGNTIKERVRSSYPGTPKKMRDLETYCSIFSITPYYYANKFENSGVPFTWGYFKEGKYSLVLKYRYQRLKNENTKIEEIASNKLEFNVVSPNKKNDQNFLIDFTEYIKQLRDSRLKAHRSKSVNIAEALKKQNQKLFKLVNKYPNSLYLSLINYVLTHLFLNLVKS